MRAYEQIVTLIRKRADSIALRMLWEIADNEFGEAQFPSEQLLDELQAFERPCRDRLRKVLQHFSQDLMEQIRALDLSYLAVRYHYKGCQMFQGNVVLVHIPPRKTEYGLSI